MTAQSSPRPYWQTRLAVGLLNFRKDLIELYLMMLRNVVRVVFTRSLVLSLLMCVAATDIYRKGEASAEVAGAVIAMSMLYYFGSMTFLAFTLHIGDPHPEPDRFILGGLVRSVTNRIKRLVPEFVPRDQSAE